MGPDTRFQPVLDAEHNSVYSTRLILCSGKHYYTLHDAVSKAGRSDEIAIVRVEELSPFPRTEIRDILQKYSSAQSVVWAQEEPQNMGAWTFVQPRIEEALKDLGSDAAVRYAGRTASASTATAVAKWHAQEKLDILAQALDGDA